MIEKLLWPRLSNLMAREAWAQFSNTGVRPVSDLLGETISWGASGGRRITASELKDSRASIVQLAESMGFPAQSSQAARAEFDARCAEALMRFNMPIGEALRDDIWSYLTAVLLPDVCKWRFPNPPDERIFGGIRNTFQRLWLRASAFDRGPSHPHRWALLFALSEDAMVQITERPLLAADARVALAFAECWKATAERIGRERMESVTRRAIRATRMTNEIIYLAALDSQALLKTILNHFEIAEGGTLE